jgi:hypothetical protein
MRRSKFQTDAERDARLAELRRQIAEGTYDTPERLEAAVEQWREGHVSGTDRRLGPPRPHAVRAR